MSYAPANVDFVVYYIPFLYPVAAVGGLTPASLIAPCPVA